MTVTVYAPVDHPGVDVPDRLRPWSVEWPSYDPVDITPPELRPGVGLNASVKEGWAEPYAHPTDVPGFVGRRAAALIPYDLEEDTGCPLNPAGRTGRCGRNLGKWGENTAVDAIVVASTGSGRHLLLIRRSDKGTPWAIPGGMVDPGETISEAMPRELGEEASVDLSHLTPKILACTHVADWRETDWAWVCTAAGLYRLSEPIPVKAGSDAIDARWFPFPDLAAVDQAVAEVGGLLYGAHRPLLATALNHIDRA